MKQVNKQQEMSIKTATMINAIAKYAVIVMNILFTSVLARILSPEDYGIVAIVTIFTTLFGRLCDMGFGTAIIQYKDLNQEDVNHIFSFTGIVAIILAVFFTFLGKPLAVFYNNHVYITICLILAISVFFNCWNMVPHAILLRDKLFVQVGMRTIVVNIIGYVVAIVCAVCGGKFYALILQSVIASVVDFIWNNHTAKLRIVKRLDIRPIKKIWNYSFFQFIFGWVNYFETNLDNILIGGFMGSTQLAYYDKGFKLISYPMNNLSGVVTPVLHPILKDYQSDKEYLYIKYVEVQKLLSLISVIITPIFFCASSEIISIVFGEQWEGAVRAFQLLSLSVYPKIMMGTTGAIYCSAGETRMLFVAGAINAIVTSIGIIAGIYGGIIETVSIGVSIANWSNMFVTFIILIGVVLKKSVAKYFKEFLGDIFMMIGVGIIIEIIFELWIIDNMFVLLIAKTFLIISINMVYLFMSNRLTTIHKLENKGDW